ncbi:WD40 repeat-like protein, partial [Aureobasidium melanogenum]
SVASVTVASDGSLLCAAVSNSQIGSVYVWRIITAKDVTTLVPVTKFNAHNTYITRVLLSPDVRHLATCSADHTARIWSVDLSNHNAIASGPGDKDNSAFELEQELDGHQRWVWDCAFSADSAYLVTACSDHYARLWELSSKQVIRQYNGHHRGAVCVALNDYSETRYSLPSIPPRRPRAHLLHTTNHTPLHYKPTQIQSIMCTYTYQFYLCNHSYFIWGNSIEICTNRFLSGYSSDAWSIDMCKHHVAICKGFGNYYCPDCSEDHTLEWQLEE